MNRASITKRTAVMGTAAAVAGVSAGLLWVWRHQADLILRRPLNEWTFSHTKWILPTADVSRSASHRPLSTALRPLDFQYRYRGRDRELSKLHSRTNTTSFLVLHGGKLVHEVYPGRFAGPDVRFFLFR